MKLRERNYSGVITSEISEREIRNKKISYSAAAEGVVLLKNDGTLPIKGGAKVALFGNGIANLIKGGTGSGDVNARHVVSVLEGFNAAPKDKRFIVVNQADVERYMSDYNNETQAWVNRVLEKVNNGAGSDMSFLTIPSETKRDDIPSLSIVAEEISNADAVIYVISRVAGEGKDRYTKSGDYYLSEVEKNELNELLKYNSRLVIVLNTGAQIDLQEWTERAVSIIYLSQPGMEAGHVLCGILDGRINPSGRLTTTWAKDYKDFPNADTFSHCNNDVDHELYEEGIYVGYRYFDTFGIKPLYPFGYGSSYTTFTTEICDLKMENNTVCCSLLVTNTGKEHAGKEVVQIYASCPAKSIQKEKVRLAGFGKTKLLEPGESETVQVTIDAKALASFNEGASAWVMDAGKYGLFSGKNEIELSLIGIVTLDETMVLETVSHISPLNTRLSEITAEENRVEQFRNEWLSLESTVKTISFKYEEEQTDAPYARKFEERAKEIAASMTEDELIAMLMGEISKGQDMIVENELVKTGLYVPGAAGETSCRFEEKYNIPAVSMADGPAGLRLLTSYDVDNKTGLIYGIGLFSAICGPQFLKEYHRENVTTYHMYTTAIPIGTMLAQTWNTALIQEIGAMVAGEMREFGVSWWLAPGMCIHRNPLCGRNFEYYSEDPLVSGKIAAAMTRGVQSVAGCGTTIKHYAANNQEDNRLFSDSIVSERALREIYLRGFEIAVKESNPMCLMTSYNKINGVPAANNYDLITTVLRDEWKYSGIVMSDWTTTNVGSAEAYVCPIAGNDLIMPGSYDDIANMKKALEQGKLDRTAMESCAARLISLLLEINSELI